MYKNSIKGYLVAMATLTLAACGGGGGSDTGNNNGGTGTTPTAFTVNTPQVNSDVTESSSFEFNLTSKGGSGSATYAVDVSYQDFEDGAITATVNGSTVNVSISDLEYSGEFTVKITGTDGAGKTDDVTLTFDVENTSAAPVLAALNAMFDAKYDIANLKSEREVLQKVAKAAFYGSDDFKQSDLDRAMNAASKDVDSNYRQSLLDTFAGKFYNRDYSTNEYYSETELKAKLSDAQDLVAEYLSEINGKIRDVTLKAGDAVPLIDLDGTLYVSDEAASQFVGNAEFMDVQSKLWKSDYEFLGAILDPSLMPCSAG
jgi:hypothetical protein|tara:strand:+ start:72328 stop:73272 length:945 start_codon:yes stop_codon:yes gene_type:complete